MKSRDASAVPPTEVEGPSDKVRSIVSIVLFIHLFAIAVALTANSAIVPSQLLSTIRGTVLRYLYVTWTDVGFDYSYLASELDMRNVVVGDITAQDGTVQSVPLEPEGATGLRHDRYARLARNVAARLQNPDQEGLLPSMIGGGMLQQAEGEPSSVVVRCELHPPVDYLSYRAGSSPKPPVQTLYQARVRLVDNQPRIVEKFETRGQVAPNERNNPAANPAVNPAATSNPQSPGIQLPPPSTNPLTPVLPLSPFAPPPGNQQP